jgi:DNA adenine methylase
MKRRARGIFTFVGSRYDDGRRDMRASLDTHFVDNVHAFNAAVFDNGKHNKAFGKDVFDLDVAADLVYIDPPYFTPNSDNDYTRRYHFVEGLVRRWRGLKIQDHTITRKFASFSTPFSSRETVTGAFDELFAKYAKSVMVVSYSSNSIPDKATISGLLKKYKEHVVVHEVAHRYSFGNQAHRVGNNANEVREFIFVAK